MGWHCAEVDDACAKRAHGVIAVDVVINPAGTSLWFDTTGIDLSGGFEIESFSEAGRRCSEQAHAGLQEQAATAGSDHVIDVELLAQTFHHETGQTRCRVSTAMMIVSGKWRTGVHGTANQPLTMLRLRDGAATPQTADAGVPDDQAPGWWLA